MPDEQKSSGTFVSPPEKVWLAIIASVQHMGGKVGKKDEKGGKMVAQMDKKLFGNYLGDRSQLEIQLMPMGEAETRVEIFAFPLNAVGQKLMFGARPGVAETVLRVLLREVGERLEGKQPAGKL